MPGSAVVTWINQSSAAWPWTGTRRDAASASRADVQSAIDAASDGDWVRIPSGSATWTSGITTTKQIGIVAQTYGGVNITHGAGSGTLLTMTSGNSFPVGIGGIDFFAGAASGCYVELYGSGTKVPLLWSLYMEVPNFQLAHALRMYCNGGVMWDSNIQGTDFVDAPGDSGCIVVKQNRAWDTASTMGSADTNGDVNLYIEDCTIANVGQCPDVDDNGRVVVRYNDLDGVSGLTHGSTSAYGGRHVEYYNNTLYTSTTGRNLSGRYYWMRNGTGVFVDNSVSADNVGYGTPGFVQMIVENGRRFSSWGHATSYPAIGPEGSGSSHQIGYGHNGSAHVSDPVYIWNNTGTGATSVSLNDASETDYSPQYNTADFVQEDRDYFVGDAKSGYSKYTYPHPLRAGVDAGQP